VTLDRNDMEGQREFFRQLGHALRRGRRWALLSMREDYVGHMDKFKRYFQNELRTTYRIDYLDPDAAMRAVEEPAAARGVTFEDEAARRLITDLRAVRADHPVQLIPRPSQQVSRRRRAEGIAPASGHRSDPSTSAPIATDVFVSTPGAAHGSPPTPTPTAAGTGPVVPDEPVVYPYVEPVLVQVVCDSLWRIRSKKPDFTRITVEDLAEVQPYNTTLSKYYRSVVREAAGRDADTERAVRDWVEQQLLTTRGLRQPTLTPPKVTDPTFVLGVLQQRYLIRDDPRPGGTWWELAHDMLVQPVIEDNRAWQLSNLAAWQVVADEWHRTGRPRDLLLQNSDLREARSAIRKIETTSLEHDFLQESIRAAEEAGRYRNAVFQLNFFRILVVLSLALNALFILRYFGWE